MRNRTQTQGGPVKSHRKVTKFEIDGSVAEQAEQKQLLEVRIPHEPPIAVLFKDITGLSFTLTASWCP